MDALRSLYQELILDHYRHPRNRGELPDSQVTLEKRNPTCGDEIRLQLRMAGGRIEAARFTGAGCSISQASASMMTERLTGRSIAEARALFDRFRAMVHGDEEAARDGQLGDLRALAGVAALPVRARCALLAWAALEDGLKGETADG